MFFYTLALDLFIVLSFFFFTLRYVAFSGLAYLMVWQAGKDAFASFRISDRLPSRERLHSEFTHSVVSSFVFSLLAALGIWMAREGWTLMYWDIGEYGLAYFAASVVGLIVLHDAYFYFTHRAMHHPKLFKFFHTEHHKSVNPSPWAAFSFNISEAVVQALFVNIVMMVMPLHPAAIGAWSFFMISMNVIGHLNHEFFPRWTPLWLMNTATHHSMHHRYYNCNFGLYFNWWDRLLGTNHQRYEQHFYAIKDKRAAYKDAVTPEQVVLARPAQGPKSNVYSSAPNA